MTLLVPALSFLLTATLVGTEPPPAQSLEGTEWHLLQLGGETVAGDAPQGEPTLTLDPEQGRASGTGGCNGFNGSYEVDGDTIRFGEIAATRMMCPEGMDTEDGFFYALEAARTYAVVDGHLELYDENGERLGRFEPGRSF